jgi:hypothetical protein
LRSLTQLGVYNDYTVIRNGHLADKPAFFGTALAEVVSENTNDNSAWNGDRTVTATNNLPWFYRGGHTEYAAVAGVFTFGRQTGFGTSAFQHGHRTILSGY